VAGLIKMNRVYPKNNLRLQAEVKFKTHLKKVDQGSWQGAGRRKSGVRHTFWRMIILSRSATQP
jgi:hypothetical protein